LFENPAILLPGGLRLRRLQAIKDRTGASPLIYDIERNLLVPVPLEFQYFIAFALDKGDLDELLLNWLASEGLYTDEYGRDETSWDRSVATELAGLLPERSGGEHLGCVYRLHDRIHCQIGAGAPEVTRAALDWLSRNSVGGAPITLHLRTGDGLDFERLARLVEDVLGRPELVVRGVDFDLSVAAACITRPLAVLLAEHPFRVRVRCDGPSETEEVPLAPADGLTFTGDTRRGLELLRDYLAPRLAVHSVLAGGARLAYLWDWARELGLRHLHVTKLGLPEADFATRQREVREFRADLGAVGDEMFYSLQAGHPPLLFEPMIRVVRRLAGRRNRLWAESSGSGCLGLVAHGEVLPFSWPGSGAGEGSETAGRMLHGERREAAAMGRDTPCTDCWSRFLCGRGPYLDPSLAPWERLEGAAGNCDFWRAEVEAGALFFERLRREDPSFFLGLAEAAVDGVFDPLDSAEGLFEWKTC
jgi:uncharacterized protein